jgi:hypothetical protein
VIQILSSLAVPPHAESPIAYKIGRCAGVVAPVDRAYIEPLLFPSGLRRRAQRDLAHSLGAGAKGALSNKALELTGRGRRRASIGRRRPHLGVGSSSASISITLAAVARSIVASRAAGSSMLIRWAASR